jgi:adenylate kinase family enzyme
VAWNQTPIYSVSDIIRQHQQRLESEELANVIDARTKSRKNDNGENIQHCTSFINSTGKIITTTTTSTSTTTTTASTTGSSDVITSQMNTGTLVDDEVVSQLVLSYLQAIDQKKSIAHIPDWYDDYGNEPIEYPHSYQGNVVYMEEQDYQRRKKHAHFIMDGYPRTPRQIDIMLQTWPVQYHLTHAIHLDIPDAVCEMKLLGRRHCTLCEGAPNVTSVQQWGFDLPPLTPMICRTKICRPNKHWIVSRPDDNDIKIVQKRLLGYRQQERALLDYYRCSNNNSNDNDSNKQPHGGTDTSGGRCISVTPYCGIDDFPKMQRTVETWFLQQQKEPQQN